MTLKTGVIIALLTLIIGSLFIWLGVFNISATEKHWPVTTRLIELVRERSIHVRSSDIEVPPLGSAEMIRSGAQNYEAMCAQCHLAPDMEPTELNVGLYPQPPVFYRSDHSVYDPAAAFWTIKNGLKLTGMPSWGASHTDQQIWELVAFISELNGMGQDKYEELAGEGTHSHTDENGHGNGSFEH
jgi:mono/diheme cytochrome c family protein